MGDKNETKQPRSGPALASGILGRCRGNRRQCVLRYPGIEHLGSKRFIVYGIAVGVISLLFVGVMYATPISYPSSAWTVAYSVLIPVPAAVLGGYFHARRA